MPNYNLNTNTTPEPPTPPYLTSDEFYAVVYQDHIPQYFTHPYDVTLYCKKLLDQNITPTIIRIKPHEPSDNTKKSFNALYPMNTELLKEVTKNINEISIDSNEFFKEYLKHPNEFQTKQQQKDNTYHFSSGQISLIFWLCVIASIITDIIKNIATGNSKLIWTGCYWTFEVIASVILFGTIGYIVWNVIKEKKVKKKND